MSESVPNEREARDADLGTAQAFSQEIPRLRAWLRRHAAAWQGIDDILQDLFLELVLANRAARRIEDTGARLFRVARNRLIDALRQRQPLNRAVSVESLGESTFGLEPNTPEDGYRRSEFVKHLLSALEALPAQQRRVFVAHELEGLSIAEIAEREGVGINTALARKRYAVLHIRKTLGPFKDHYFID